MSIRASTAEAFQQRVVAELLVIFAIALWWAASSNAASPILPSPQAVLEKLLTFGTRPEVAAHAAITTARVALSVVLGLGLGFLLAFAAYSHPHLQRIVIDRVLVVLNGLPSVGWAILAVVWFRVSDFTVVFIQVMILLPFSIIYFYEGLRNQDRELLEMARSFSTWPAATLVKVTLPMLMPYAIAALRVSYGVCWKISLVSELFGAQSGLGYLMLRAQSVGDATMVIATCLAIVFLFILGEILIINPLSRLARQDIMIERQ